MNKRHKLPGKGRKTQLFRLILKRPSSEKKPFNKPYYYFLKKGILITILNFKKGYLLILLARHKSKWR